MPKKQSLAAKDGGFRGFFNYSLTDADKAAIKQAVAKKLDLQDVYEQLCGSSYKVTVSRGGVADGWFVSCTGKGAENPNQNRCLTTRHYDFDTAIASVHHIIAIVYDFGEWPDEQKDSWDW